MLRCLHLFFQGRLGAPQNIQQDQRLLWRAAGCPAPTSTDCPFNDISTKGFYYKAMLWAVENGITSGTSKTTFAPDTPCTRGQVVTFLYRAYN